MNIIHGPIFNYVKFKGRYVHECTFHNKHNRYIYKPMTKPSKNEENTVKEQTGKPRS